MVRETRHLWVGNLPDNIREDRIREHFKRYGKVQSVKILPRRDDDAVGGVSATVSFIDIRSAAKAHGAENKVDERLLKTDYYEPPASSTATSAIFIHERDDGLVRPGSSPYPGNRTPRLSEERSYYYDRQGERESYLRRQPGYHDDDGYQNRGRTRDRYNRSTTSSSSNYQDGTERTPAHFRGHTGRQHFEQQGYTPTDQFTEEKEGVSPGSRLVRRPNTVSSTVSSPPQSRSGSRHRHQKHRSHSGSRSESRSRSRSSSRSSSGSRLASSSSKLRSSSSDSSSRSLSPSKSQSPTTSYGSQNSGKCSKSDRPASTVTAPVGSTGFLQSTVATPNSNPSSTGASQSGSSEGTAEREDKRPLGICVRNLPVRSTDTSLKDGLFHEYKKHGKVTVVKVIGQGTDRYAVVCFKKPEDVEKALEVSKDKLFFGCKIEVTAHEGLDGEDNEFRPLEAELDEYHPKATRTLFIGNLEKDITTAELRKHFEQFGEIIEIDIKKQGSASSYAFIQYSDIASVVKAMRKLDGENLGANRIKLGFGKSMPTNCVWLDGIVDTVTEKFLTRNFSRYGPVAFCVVDREKGHALVYFDSLDYAQHAVQEMRGRVISGKKLQVDFASRECQTAFLEKIEMSGQIVQGERPWERRDRRGEFDGLRDDRFGRDGRTLFDSRGFNRYEAQQRTGRGAFRGLQRGTYNNRGRGQAFTGRYENVYHEDFERRHRFLEKEDGIEDGTSYEDRLERLKHSDAVEWTVRKNKKHRNSVSDQESHHSQSPPQSRHHSRSPPPKGKKGSKERTHHRGRGSPSSRSSSHVSSPARDLSVDMDLLLDKESEQRDPLKKKSSDAKSDLKDTLSLSSVCTKLEALQDCSERHRTKSNPDTLKRRSQDKSIEDVVFTCESPSQLERKRRLLAASGSLHSGKDFNSLAYSKQDSFVQDRLKSGDMCNEDNKSDIESGELDEESVLSRSASVDSKYLPKQIQDILSSSDSDSSSDEVRPSKKKLKGSSSLDIPSATKGKSRHTKEPSSVVSKKYLGKDHIACSKSLDVDGKYPNELLKTKSVDTLLCSRKQLDPRRPLDHNKVSSSSVSTLLRVKKVHDKFEVTRVGSDIEACSEQGSLGGMPDTVWRKHSDPLPGLVSSSENEVGSSLDPLSNFTSKHKDDECIDEVSSSSDNPLQANGSRIAGVRASATTVRSLSDPVSMPLETRREREVSPLSLPLPKFAASLRSPKTSPNPVSSPKANSQSPRENRSPMSALNVKNIHFASHDGGRPEKQPSLSVEEKQNPLMLMGEPKAIPVEALSPSPSPKGIKEESETSSDSEGSVSSPNRPSIEERIRALDEKYNALTGPTRTFNSTVVSDTPAPPTIDYQKYNIKKRPRFPVLSPEFRAEPSEIMKTLLAKTTILDQDSKRLEHINEKYEPKDIKLDLSPKAKPLFRTKAAAKEFSTPITLPSLPQTPTTRFSFSSSTTAASPGSSLPTTPQSTTSPVLTPAVVNHVPSLSQTPTTVPISSPQQIIPQSPITPNPNISSPSPTKNIPEPTVVQTKVATNTNLSSQSVSTKVTETAKPSPPVKKEVLPVSSAITVPLSSVLSQPPPQCVVPPILVKKEPPTIIKDSMKKESKIKEIAPKKEKDIPSKKEPVSSKENTTKKDIKKEGTQKETCKREHITSLKEQPIPVRRDSSSGNLIKERRDSASQGSISSEVADPPMPMLTGAVKRRVSSIDSNESDSGKSSKSSDTYPDLQEASWVRSDSKDSKTVEPEAKRPKLSHSQSRESEKSSSKHNRSPPPLVKKSDKKDKIAKTEKLKFTAVRSESCEREDELKSSETKFTELKIKSKSESSSRSKEDKKFKSKESKEKSKDRIKESSKEKTHEYKVEPLVSSFTIEKIKKEPSLEKMTKELPEEKLVKESSVEKTMNELSAVIKEPCLERAPKESSIDRIGIKETSLDKFFKEASLEKEKSKMERRNSAGERTKESKSRSKSESKFSFLEEEPAYFSMYDKVKARSSQNQTLKDQANSETMRQKFNQLKQSRAKKEGKSRSTELDSDRDSDLSSHQSSDSDNQSKLISVKLKEQKKKKPVIASSSDENEPSHSSFTVGSLHHKDDSSDFFSDSDVEAQQIAALFHRRERKVDISDFETTNSDEPPHILSPTPSKKITSKQRHSSEKSVKSRHTKSDADSSDGEMTHFVKRKEHKKKKNKNPEPIKSDLDLSDSEPPKKEEMKSSKRKSSKSESSKHETESVPLDLPMVLYGSCSKERKSSKESREECKLEDDGGLTKQKHSSKKKKKSKKSSRTKERKSEKLNIAPSTPRHPENLEMKELIDESSVSSKYIGSPKGIPNSPPVLQPSVFSDSEIKSEFSDYEIDPERGISMWKNVKTKMELSTDECGLRTVKNESDTFHVKKESDSDPEHSELEKIVNALNESRERVHNELSEDKDYSAIGPSVSRVANSFQLTDSAYDDVTCDPPLSVKNISDDECKKEPKMEEEKPKKKKKMKDKKKKQSKEENSPPPLQTEITPHFAVSPLLDDDSKLTEDIRLDEEIAEEARRLEEELLAVASEETSTFGDGENIIRREEKTQPERHFEEEAAKETKRLEEELFSSGRDSWHMKDEKPYEDDDVSEKVPKLLPDSLEDSSAKDDIYAGLDLGPTDSLASHHGRSPHYIEGEQFKIDDKEQGSYDMDSQRKMEDDLAVSALLQEMNNDEITAPELPKETDYLNPIIHHHHTDDTLSFLLPDESSSSLQIDTTSMPELTHEESQESSGATVEFTGALNQSLQTPVPDIKSVSEPEETQPSPIMASPLPVNEEQQPPLIFLPEPPSLTDLKDDEEEPCQEPPELPVLSETIQPEVESVDTSEPELPPQLSQKSENKKSKKKKKRDKSQKNESKLQINRDSSETDDACGLPESSSEKEYEKSIQDQLEGFLLPSFSPPKHEDTRVVDDEPLLPGFSEKISEAAREAKSSTEVPSRVESSESDFDALLKSTVRPPITEEMNSEALKVLSSPPHKDTHYDDSSPVDTEPELQIDMSVDRDDPPKEEAEVSSDVALDRHDTEAAKENSFFNEIKEMLDDNEEEEERNNIFEGGDGNRMYDKLEGKVPHSSEISEIIETLNSPKEQEAEEPPEHETEEFGNLPELESSNEPTEMLSNADDIQNQQPVFSENESKKKSERTRRSKRTKSRKSSTNRSEVPAVETPAALVKTAKRGRTTSTERTRRSLRSDNSNSDNLLLEPEDRATSNEAKLDLSGVDTEPETSLQEASTISHNSEPEQPDLAISFDNVSKDSSEINLTNPSASESVNDTPPELKPVEFFFDQHKEEPKKKRGRKKKYSGDHHPSYFSPPPADKAESKHDDSDHKEAQKQKDGRPWLSSGWHQSSEHKQSKGSSSAYDIFEFRDSEDEELTFERDLQKHQETSKSHTHEHGHHESRSHDSHEREKKHDEGKHKSFHHEEKEAPTKEYVTELSQHGKISITIRLHQKDGHDGSSASTAEVVKTSEAVSAEEPKLEHQRGEKSSSKQDHASKQEHGSKQEHASKQEHMSKQEHVSKQEHASKQDHPPKQDHTSKQDHAPKQDQASKQDHAPGDSSQIKTRKSARLMSQVNKTTVDEVIEDVVKGHFKNSEENSAATQEGTGPVTRSSRRTRVNRQNEDATIQKEDSQDSQKSKSEPVFVIPDNKVKEAQEPPKVPVTCSAPTVVTETVTAAAEPEQTKSESTALLRKFRIKRSAAKHEQSKDTAVPEAPDTAKPSETQESASQDLETPVKKENQESTPNPVPVLKVELPKVGPKVPTVQSDEHKTAPVNVGNLGENEDDSDSRSSPTVLIDPVTGFLTPVNKKGEPAVVPSDATAPVSQEKVVVPPAPKLTEEKVTVPPPKPEAALVKDTTPAETHKKNDSTASTVQEKIPPKPTSDHVQRPPVLTHAAAQRILDLPIIEKPSAAASVQNTQSGPAVHSQPALVVNAPAQQRPPAIRISSEDHPKKIDHHLEMPVQKGQDLREGVHISVASSTISGTCAPSISIPPPQFSTSAGSKILPPPLGQPPVSLGQQIPAWTNRPPTPQYSPFSPVPSQNLSALSPVQQHSPRISQPCSTAIPSAVASVPVSSQPVVRTGGSQQQVPGVGQDVNTKTSLPLHPSNVPIGVPPVAQAHIITSQGRLEMPTGHGASSQPPPEHLQKPIPITPTSHMQQGPPHLKPDMGNYPTTSQGSMNTSKSNRRTPPSSGARQPVDPATAAAARQAAVSMPSTSSPAASMPQQQQQGSKQHESRNIKVGHQSSKHNPQFLHQPGFSVEAGYEIGMPGGPHVPTTAPNNSGGVIADLLQNSHLIQHKNYFPVAQFADRMNVRPAGPSGLHVGNPTPPHTPSPQSELLHLRTNPQNPLLMTPHPHLPIHPQDLNALVHHQLMYAELRARQEAHAAALSMPPRFPYPPLHPTPNFRQPLDPRLPHPGMEGKLDGKDAKAEEKMSQQKARIKQEGERDPKAVPCEQKRGDDIEHQRHKNQADTAHVAVPSPVMIGGLRPPPAPYTSSIRQLSPHIAASPHERITDSPSMASSYSQPSRTIPPPHLTPRVEDKQDPMSRSRGVKSEAVDRDLKPPAAHQNMPTSIPYHTLEPSGHPQSLIGVPSVGSPAPGFLESRPLHSPGALALKKETAHSSMLLHPMQEQALQEAHKKGNHSRAFPRAPPLQPPSGESTRQAIHSMPQTGLEAPLHGPPPAHAMSQPAAVPSTQPQTPPHASQVPPQGDSFLLQRYPVMWQGLLALKNDQAAVQMHFVSGNSQIAIASLPPMTDGGTPPVRIAQRMRLEQTQLEGVARKMQMVDEHCILLALPCGRDHMDVLQQSNNLRNGFINYLQLKQAAGIVNAAAPGSQQPAYVIHIFPSCEFSNENLARIAPDLLHSVSDIAHLLVIIATV